MTNLKTTEPYNQRPPEPKILPKNYTQGVDSLSSEDFLRIYMETLRYQDPFQSQDLSKMLDDMAKLNQIKHMNDVKTFMEDLKGWFNQMTLLSSLSLIGKDFIFSSDGIDTIKSEHYFILSSEELKGVTVQLMDGEEVIKEMQVDLRKGLNPLDLEGLPKGQFEIRLMKGGVPLEGFSLGFQGKVKSVSVVKGELLFELENGEFISPSKIIYTGGT
ncbi:MAG: flagellar hook assembly protein FlgD [Aquificaceae bacterium]